MHQSGARVAFFSPCLGISHPGVVGLRCVQACEHTASQEAAIPPFVFTCLSLASQPILDVYARLDACMGHVPATWYLSCRMNGNKDVVTHVTLPYAAQFASKSFADIGSLAVRACALSAYTLCCTSCFIGHAHGVLTASLVIPLGLRRRWKTNTASASAPPPMRTTL